MHNFLPSNCKALETQTTSVPQPTVMQPPPVQMTFVKPLSYQFQVAEYEKDGAVVKVELQVQATTHDEKGNVMYSSGFIPVPRVRLPLVDHK